MLTFACEASEPDHREQLVEFLLEEFKRIDLLVSVPPASAPEGDLLSLSPEQYAPVIDAGQTAPLFLAQMIANEMARLREAGEIESGKIVFVNSMGAETTLSDRPAECIAAAARAAMTRLFADALSEHAINVYEVRAGLIFTQGLDEAHRHYNRLIHEGLIPLRRWGRAQDVGLTVAAIATDLLPFSTGQVINVDGGFHLKRL